MRDSYEKIKRRIANISVNMEFVDESRPKSRGRQLSDLGSVECLEIESYKDTLETLLHNNSKRADLLEFDELLLDYSLNFESSLRQSICEFDNNLKKQYKVYSGDSTSEIDMQTTFNYLIGLRQVEKKSLTIEDVNYTVYYGVNRNEDKIKVLWRDGDINYSKEKEKITYDDFDYVFVNGDSAIPNSQSISERINRILS